jgi:apolipoprotein N-acyltransferase
LELTVWSFLLSLAYYPEYFGFLAWLALIRPFAIISRLEGRDALKAAYFFGFLFNLFSLYWIAQVTPPGMLSAVVIVAFYYAAVLMVFNRLYRIKPILGLVSAPFLWTGMEYFRTLSQFAFPWSDLGYTQSYYLYILQIVSVISVHGLSFLIVTVNVLVWQVWRKELTPERRLTALWAALAVVAVLVAHGWVVMPPIEKPGTMSVALLQGSVPIEEKWRDDNQDFSFDLYDSLTQSVTDSAELYVWPETSAPTYLSHNAHHRFVVGQTARNSRAWHLVGALGAKQTGEQVRHYNSCYLFAPTGQMESRIDKVKLVPFTEQVPYQDHLPLLRKEFLTEYLTFIKTYNVRFWSDFYPGDSVMLVELEDTRVALLICFESTFPELGITNDTWFGHSVGIHMHSRIFITRAVENRCWGVRAANSGLTYIVDGYGCIRAELPLDAVAALSGRIRPLEGFSFFTRFGDIAGVVSFLITFAAICILIIIWLLRKFHFVGRSG